MKLLFDQNLSFKLCARLGDLFPGSSQVHLLGLAEADDGVIWRHAAANGFMLVSQDSDFADMAGLYGPPPKVVWLRCGTSRSTPLKHCFADAPTPSPHSSGMPRPPA